MIVFCFQYEHLDCVCHLRKHTHEGGGKTGFHYYNQQTISKRVTFDVNVHFFIPIYKFIILSANTRKKDQVLVVRSESNALLAEQGT